MLFTAIEASAGSATGTDLLANTFVSNAGTYRRIRKAALVGSTTSVGRVDIYIGGTFVARLAPTTGGAAVVPIEAKDFIIINSDIAAVPMEPIRAIIQTVGVTNVMALTIDVEELG